MCACADACNIYIEQVPDYLNSDGRFLCRFFQFLFRIFCHRFSKNWNNPMYFWVLASGLFLGVVRSTRSIFACRCLCQHVKLIWPEVSLEAAYCSSLSWHCRTCHETSTHRNTPSLLSWHTEMEYVLWQQHDMCLPDTIEGQIPKMAKLFSWGMAHALALLFAELLWSK